MMISFFWFTRGRWVSYNIFTRSFDTKLQNPPTNLKSRKAKLAEI
jgi:hypothetical protein